MNSEAVPIAAARIFDRKDAHSPVDPVSHGKRDQRQPVLQAQTVCFSGFKRTVPEQLVEMDKQRKK